ncbi:hypothetical protein [Turicimonas muris]|uniref:hypothetical protein n=1 Tax=Turicimonas muris TaxID=1796652 RepID=UPI00248CFBC1|nr:hypothetical protein [Turicimonas muris]
MLKSKKPRNKKYPTKLVKRNFWTKEWYEVTHRKLDTAALLAELTLPKGKLSEKDIDLLEDTVNWGIAILFHRYKKLDVEELLAAEPVILAGREALSAVIDRKLSGVTHEYIAKGDELNVIRDCLSILVPLIKDAIAITPEQAMREFKWTLRVAATNQKKSQKRKQLETSGQNLKHKEIL